MNSSPFAFIPIGKTTETNFKDTVAEMKKYFESKDMRLRFERVTEGDVKSIREFVDTDEDIVLDNDNSDYLYLTENLIGLKGKKYDGKRNHINKFKKLYEYEYLPLTVDNINDCNRIMEEWFEGRTCEEKRELCWEKSANLEVLKNYETLKCRGAIIKVNGKVEAFTIGEALNDETAVIHIEKANSNIQGLYTFVNQQFCQNEWKEMKYINREQDLGLEGLRKAKLSYHPEMLVKKYSIKVF